MTFCLFNTLGVLPSQYPTASSNEINHAVINTRVHSCAFQQIVVLSLSSDIKVIYITSVLQNPISRPCQYSLYCFHDSPKTHLRMVVCLCIFLSTLKALNRRLSTHSKLTAHYLWIKSQSMRFTFKQPQKACESIKQQGHWSNERLFPFRHICCQMNLNEISSIPKASLV